MEKKKFSIRYKANNRSGNNLSRTFPATALILCGVTLLSCGHSAKNDHATVDSPKIDTVVTDTVVEASDSARTYFSSDLKSFGIRGDVAQRSEMRHGAGVVYPIPTMELTFDTLGNFTGSLMGLYPKQNEDGINYAYSMNYEDGTSWELTYTEMNDHSFPLKAEIIESGPQGTAKANITYFGYEYDREGNWVMRSASMSREFVETDTEEKTSTFHKWKELVSYKYNDRDNGDPDDRK
ncbi:MAG: hypothetical protein K2K81_04235 [Muribaculaceae bacterium]|nr:hypothetical protein [Muribaculaceae bacterium]